MAWGFGGFRVELSDVFGSQKEYIDYMELIGIPQQESESHKKINLYHLFFLRQYGTVPTNMFPLAVNI